MAMFASLTLVFLAAAPQAPQEQESDPRLTHELASGVVRELKSRFEDWIEAEFDAKAKSTPQRRSKLSRAQSALLKAYTKANEKEPVFKHMGSVLQICEGVFPYERVSVSGEFKKYEGEWEGVPPFDVLAPRRYKEDSSFRSMLILTGRDPENKGAWAAPRDYHEAAWKGSPLVEDTFFIVPQLIAGDDYDDFPDISGELGQKVEFERIKSIYAPYGDMQRMFRFDRRQMFLDCGRGTTAFGLRFATYYPDALAGIILRDPVDVIGKMQLESLAAVPILLVSTPATKAACEKLEKALNEIHAGLVTITNGEGASPYGNAQAAISEWVAKQTRVLYPPEVRIAPNHNDFQKASWVEICAADPLDGAVADRPLLHVKADRATNRIVISSRKVHEIGLYLNDAIVDLDQKITIVVNGEEVRAEKFTRSLPVLQQYLLRTFDPTFLYPAYYRFDLPKPEAAADKPSDSGGSDEGKSGIEDGKDTGDSSGR